MTGLRFLLNWANFDAILVVEVRDHGARCIGPAAFEEHSLGREVLVHGLVIVEMIARQVGKDRDVEGHPEHALLRQRVRGTSITASVAPKPRASLKS